MDMLVAKHSYSAHDDELSQQDQEDDFSANTPALSLKFALPPIANVSISYLPLIEIFTNLL